MTGGRGRVTAAGVAFGCALAYGALKLDWALGGTLLMRESPLPRAARDDLLHRTADAVLGHWMSVALAVVGMAVALQLSGRFRPHGRIRRGVLLAGSWAGCLFMVSRAIGLLGYGFCHDLRLLTGAVSVRAATTDLVRYQAGWDLLLWSPYWLVFGLCWGVAAWHYGRGRSAGGPGPGDRR
ncbi:DUF3995 domain-containing protein [Streptomyces sp. NPDC050355]|uniref:DUF3995 domain-containing protein n=1 Tax=Streptomyces sp. NPDC050355 TaxID=3365609 RepID=UPI0037917CE2